MLRNYPVRSLAVALTLLAGTHSAYAKLRPDQLPKTASRTTAAPTAKIASTPASTPAPASPANPKTRPGTASSSVALTSNGNPIRYGAPIVLTATVTPNTAAGSVEFYNGGIPIGSAPVVQGIATFSTVLLSAGTDSLTAHYDGSSSFLAANSPVLLQTISDGVGVGFPFYTTVNVGTNPPPAPAWVSVGDVNNDGKQDLVSILSGTNQIAVSLGTGTGTFAAPRVFATGASPYALVIADFNGDGIEDLAVTSADGIDILLGNGGGSFLPYVPYATPALGSGDSSFGLAVADFNGDGIPDLVVTDGLGTNTAGQNVVSVFLGAGNGTFPTRTDYPVGSLPQAVTVGDFNNDGRSDFAVADILDNSVYVYLGNGSGGFSLAPGSPITTGNYPNDIAAFNLHGQLDLVVANSGDNQIQILTGTNTGNFTPQPGINVGNQPDSLVAADFNGDLVPDIAVLNSSDNSVTVLLNIQGELSTEGTFGTCVTCNYVQVSAGDFNNDGVTDLVIADQGQDTPPGGLNILPGEACFYAVSPATIYQDDTFANQTVGVSGNGSSCAWTAVNSIPWVTLNTSGGSGVTGAVVATIAPNSTGVDRTGTFTVAGQTVTVVQRGTATIFSDVAASAYYFDAVNLFSQKGITAGCATGKYCPTENVSRAQMAIFIVTAIYNGSNSFPYSPTPYFSDVPAGSFGFAWIQRMYELGITAGCGPGIFCPNETVSRDQMAIFIVKARFGSSTAFTYPSTPYFTDVPASYFAFDWIQRLRYDNITDGCTATTYCPTEVVTRGDMAIFVMIGEFNDLLPAGTPVISAISPAVLAHGNTAVFTVTGVNTAFAAGQSQLVFGSTSGITVNTINVNSPTSITVSLSAATSAPLQPNSIYVQTGTQEAVFPNALTIQ